MKIINNVSQAMYQWILNDNRKPPKEDYYRVSELINPPCQRQLLIKHWDDITLLASEFIFAMSGTAMHSILEDYKPPAESFCRLERVMEISVSGIIVKGQADLILDHVLEDYKNCGVWAAQQRPIKPEWVNQTNLYALLSKKVFNHTIKRIFINCILRDWTESKSVKRDYPDTPYMRLSVPMKEEPEQLAYLNDRVNLHTASSYEPCTPEERWRKETVYKIMKAGVATARMATYPGPNWKKGDDGLKIYSYAKAEELMNTHKRCAGQKGLSIVKFPGEDTKCKKYCPVRAHCPHNIETIKEPKLGDGYSQNE